MDLVEHTEGQPIEIVKVPDVPKLCDTFQGTKGRVDIGDCSLYTETEQGSGKYPLILLHGGPGGTHHDFHPYLSSAARSFQSVIYYDQRGCGESDYQSGVGYSIGQAADDLEALRKTLNFEKLVVLGHSYGGILAQTYALKCPQSLAGLILVSSGIGFPVHIRSRQGSRISEEEGKRIKEIWQMHRNGEFDMQTAIYNAQLNGDWKRQHAIEPNLERMAQTALYEWKHDQKYRATVGGEINIVDMKGKFAEFKVPTLIIEGDDLTWDVQKPQILKENHPHAQLVTLLQTNHVPFAEQSDAFFKQLDDFARTLS